MHRTIGLEAYAVDLDTLTPGDRVYLENQPLVAITIDHSRRLVLTRTRKDEAKSKRKSYHASELTTRPRRLIDVAFANATEASECAREEVAFVPVGPPKAHTTTCPGTQAKVDVLAARYAAGEDLWHEADYSIADYELERQAKKRYTLADLTRLLDLYPGLTRRAIHQRLAGPGEHPQVDDAIQRACLRGKIEERGGTFWLSSPLP